MILIYLVVSSVKYKARLLNKYHQPPFQFNITLFVPQMYIIYLEFAWKQIIKCKSHSEFVNNTTGKDFELSMF